MLIDTRTCVFWDLDETLVHTYIDQPKLGSCIPDFRFIMPGDGDVTVSCHLRQGAVEAVNFSRELYGEDNVFILTASILDYAKIINRLSGLNFKDDQIISREIIHAHSMHRVNIKPLEIANSKNILIDDLPPRINHCKLDLVGVRTNRYLQIHPYYGYDLVGDTFLQDTTNFLTKLHNYGKKKAKGH